MIGAVIDFLDLRFKTLGFRTLGLATQVIDNKLKQPVTYSKDGEGEAINIELNTIYHRILTGPSIERETGVVGCSDIQKRTYRVRLFASFDRELICQDSLQGVETVISNLLILLNNQTIRSIKQAYGLNLVSTSPVQSYRDKEAWELEIGAPYNSTQGIVAIDYSLELKGSASCFEVIGCDGEVVDWLSLLQGEICPTVGTPATVTLNGVLFGTVASGGTLAGLVQYVNGTPVGSLVGSIWTIPNPAACGDATITVNGEAYSTVAAGGSDDIPVVNSALTPIGTVAPGGDVTIPDLDITVNGSAYGSTPATVDFDVDVVDSSRAPTGSLNAFGEWEVASSFASTARLIKTDQQLSQATGDDGDIRAGRSVDFYTLNEANFFGTTDRFTGIAGGYYDRVAMAFKLLNGSVSNLAGAFPENITLDWSQYDASTGDVMGYMITSIGTLTWANAIANSLTHTTASYASGWRLPNIFELQVLASYRASWVVAYPPFNFSSQGFWTSTTEIFAPYTRAYQLNGNGQTLYLAKTGTAVTLPCRLFNISEL